MAEQRKSPNAANRPGKTTGTSSSSARSGAQASAAKAGTARAGTTKASSATKATSATKTAAKPRVPGTPPKKKSTSIVNQRQTPWMLIAIVAVLVVFAAGVVIFAVTRHKDSGYDGNRYTRPEIAAAKAIPGMFYKAEPNHEHVGPGAQITNPIVQYDTAPPVGGNHSAFWAGCDGVVYDHQLANENAVHMLEHGAVWITYDPKQVTQTQLAALKKLVDGVGYMALTPYQNLDSTLKHPISLQAWGYRLAVDSPSDPRVQKFIDLFRGNNEYAPEPNGNCSGQADGFNAAQSTPGHPFNG